MCGGGGGGVYKIMEKILLLLKVIFTQDSEVEICIASPDSEASVFFINNLFSSRFQPVQKDFQNALTWMIDKADGFVVLAEL